MDTAADHDMCPVLLLAAESECHRRHHHRRRHRCDRRLLKSSLRCFDDVQVSFDEEFHLQFRCSHGRHRRRRRQEEDLYY